MITIDVSSSHFDMDKLYHTMLNYFGTPTYGFTVAVVEALHQAFASEDYSTIIAFAVQEGFNLNDFSI